MPTRRKKHRPIKLAAEARALLAYWQEALRESESARASMFDVGSKSEEVPLNDIERGRCHPALVQRLRDKAAKDGKARTEEAPDDRRGPKIFKVLLCPVRLRKKDREAAGPVFLEALWVPAELTDDGRLLPGRNTLPWIPRGSLEPMVGESAVTVASVAKVERFFRKNPAAPSDSWAAYWAYCADFFRFASGAHPNKFQLDGYEARNGLAVQDNSAGGMSAFLRIYEDVLNGERHPGIIPALAGITEPKRHPFSKRTGALHRFAQRHCGQFEGKFALAPSQRRAVHRFFETPDNDFLCVTGPPGTGKTTFIQSIVASAFVRAAQTGADSPPLILAAGATNQSVMNIIDSFGRANTANDIWAERWLPRVFSFGTFCCSETKSRDIEGYQLELKNGAGLSADMETPEYIAEAEKYFSSRFAAAWGNKAGPNIKPAKAAALLRNALQRELTQLYRQSQQLKDGSLTEWLQSLVGLRPKRPYDEVFAGLAQYDTTFRYRAFLFAVHYWEARWLEAARKIVDRRQSMRETSGRNRASLADWHRRAMVTPAFVSTLSMAGRFFGGRPEAYAPPLDLLIFDEAGQISPETAIPCCALAKKGLVVGDYLQLEPVWGISPHVDRQCAMKHKLLKASDDARWESLCRRGVLASRSSFMELALKSSRRIDDNTLGVFLTEHRRSVPPIVGFCNTLAYKNRLEPKRPELPERILPAFGYLHVPGVCERSGSSRQNRKESKQLVAWLAANEQDLLKFYGATRLSDVVAVISPFAAQIQDLKRKLLPLYPGMVVGTVHSLQGSEKAVVLFSLVYDPTIRDKHFLNQGVNLLNVAVSRAKDSFIVVGNMGALNSEENNASGLLARYLFASPQNELVPSVYELPDKVAEADVVRYDTLGEHQDALLDALTEAKTEVIIVSPQISRAAIEHDRIHEHIRAARARGVSIVVYTDSNLDMTEQGLKENAAAGRALIAEAGAEVRITKNIHNKSLCIDGEIIIEGSFNWLSAVRRLNSRHQNHETSWRITGTKARAAIHRLHAEMEYRNGAWQAVQAAALDEDED